MHPNLLEQLRVFRTIVDCGSFSKGAERLHKTVSSVSYTVSNRESQLQLTLFDRSSYRLKLTEAGNLIYAESELLLRQADRFYGNVGMLTKGEKPELRLSVEHLFPRRVLLDALAQLTDEGFAPQVSVQVGEMEQVMNDVRSGNCDLGLHSIDLRLSFRDIDGIQIGSTENMLVAAPHHPLAQRDEPFHMPELENHRQLVLALSEIPKGKDNYMIHRTETWTLGDVETLIGVLKKGLGWAFIHRHFVERDLASGELVTLNCRDIQSWRLHRFGVSWLLADPPSGSHQRFVSLLQSCFSDAAG